jgi:hypothetical protein
LTSSFIGPHIKQQGLQAPAQNVGGKHAVQYSTGQSINN